MYQLVPDDNVFDHCRFEQHPFGKLEPFLTQPRLPLVVVEGEPAEILRHEMSHV